MSLQTKQTNYNTYDEYVPLLVGDKGSNATQWPNARILLHMLKRQYDDTKTIKFTAPSEYGDAFYHETGQNNSTTAKAISDDYVVAMRNILNNGGTPSTDLSNQVTKARLTGGYIKAVLDVLYTGSANTRDMSGLIKAIDMSATVKGYASNGVNGGNPGLNGANAFTIVAGTGLYDTAVPVTTFNNHTYDGDSKMIPFKFSKNLLKLILETSYQRYITAQAKRTSDFFNVTEVTGSYPETYFRKGTDPNKLFTTDANGKEIEVQKGSAEFMKLTEAGDCFTLGLKDASSMQKCSKMIKDCLTGKQDGVRQCQTYMNTAFFAQASQIEVDAMNPAIALDLLRSFGFAQRTKTNKELGTDLVVIDSAKEWIITLKTHHQASNSSAPGNKLTSTEIDTIANQKGLLDYLDLVSIKINSSPQILNPGYSGKKPTQNAAAFTGTTFHKYGMLPKEAVQGRTAPSLSSIVHIQNQVLSQRNLLSGIYGIPIVGFMQSGGSELQAQLAGAYGNIQPIKLSDYADNIFQSFLVRLTAFNKSLDNTDKAEVEKIIKELKVIEAKLEKANKYTTQYSDMLSAHGDTAGSVISYDHIQKFVDKRNNYFKRSTTAQDKMFSIFEVMANVNNKEAPEESKSVGAYPNWITHN
jgi:hypothetical protein